MYSLRSVYELNQFSTQKLEVESKTLHLECEVHCNNVWVLDLMKDVALGLGVRYLPFLSDDLLVQNFHCEELISFNAITLFHEEHLAEGTLAHHLVLRTVMNLCLIDPFIFQH
jgi:hypothetical protein